MSQSPQHGLEDASDRGSDGSHLQGESGFVADPPQEVTSTAGNLEADANPSDGRRQLKQILERKLNRGSDPSDPRNADTLELQLDASEAERCKDLSWSALLNPGMNQSMEPIETLKEPVEVPKGLKGKQKEPLKGSPSNRSKGELKPSSKSASVKSDTPKRKEAPRKQTFSSARDLKEEVKGGASARSFRKDSDSRRSEEAGNASERGGRSLILQLAKKDQERRSGKTPDSMNVAKPPRMYTESSEESLGNIGIITPKSLPAEGFVSLGTNLRLPEVPKLQLEALGSGPGSRKSDSRPRSKSPVQSSSPKVSPDSNRPRSRETSKKSPESSRENEPSPAGKKPMSKPPLSPKLQFETEEAELLPEAVLVESLKIEERTNCETKEAAIQTDVRFHPKLQRVMEVLSDQKVLKGLKFVGGFSRYLQSVGFRA